MFLANEGQSIATITMVIPILRPDQLTQIDAWLRSVLWDLQLPGGLKDDTSENNRIEVHRLKARLPLTNGDVKLVQGVREIFEILDTPASNGEPSEGSGDSQGKMVLIGRHLLNVAFEESLRNMIKSPP